MSSNLRLPAPPSRRTCGRNERNAFCFSLFSCACPEPAVANCLVVQKKLASQTKKSRSFLVLLSACA
jgi:hypothetical protein